MALVLPISAFLGGWQEVHNYVCLLRCIHLQVMTFIHPSTSVLELKVMVHLALRNNNGSQVTNHVSTFQERYGISSESPCNSRASRTDDGRKIHQGLMRQVLDHLHKCQHSAWGGHVTRRTLPGLATQLTSRVADFIITRSFIYTLFLLKLAPTVAVTCCQTATQQQRLKVSED
jgi:hypothetical protein